MLEGAAALISIEVGLQRGRNVEREGNSCKGVCHAETGVTGGREPLPVQAGTASYQVSSSTPDLSRSSERRDVKGAWVEIWMGKGTG